MRTRINYNWQSDTATRIEPLTEADHTAEPKAPTVAELSADGFEPLAEIAPDVPAHAKTAVRGVKLIKITPHVVVVTRDHHLSREQAMPLSKVFLSDKSGPIKPQFFHVGGTFTLHLPVWLYRKVFKSL